MALRTRLHFTEEPLFLMDGFIFKIFDLTENSRRIIRFMMFNMAVIYVFRAFTTTNIVGILRGGGDVKAALALDIVPMYLYGLPVSIITALVLRLDMTMVFLFRSFENLIQLTAGMIRFSSRKWIRNVTVPMEPDSTDG